MNTSMRFKILRPKEENSSIEMWPIVQRIVDYESNKNSLSKCYWSLMIDDLQWMNLIEFARVVYSKMTSKYLIS